MNRESKAVGHSSRAMRGKVDAPHTDSPDDGPVRHSSRAMRGQYDIAHTDWRIAALAARQYGVVARSQLVALGVGPDAIDRRARCGRLHRLNRGVYAVGHEAVGVNARYLAAVLACGSGAVLSHRSAAALWDLRSSDAARVDVTVAYGGGEIGSIRRHRSRSMRDEDRTRRERIPCTAVARTLLDLAAVLDRRGLERACERAVVLRILDARALTARLTNASGHRGTGTLRRVLAGLRPGETITRSELEERFLALLRAHGILQPSVNAWIALADGAGVTVDFLWRGPRVVVETDGFETHATRAAFRRDRERDAALVTAGYRVVRFTWDQVVGTPEQVVATVRMLLDSYVARDPTSGA